MSFLDDLRKIGQTIDPNVGVQANEVRQVLAALVAHVEHGDALTEAVDNGPQAVSDLLTDAKADEAEVKGQVDTDADALRRQVSDLQAQLAARRATDQATQVTHNGEEVAQ